MTRCCKDDAQKHEQDTKIQHKWKHLPAIGPSLFVSIPDYICFHVEMDKNSYLNIMLTGPQGWRLSLRMPWSLSSMFASSFQSKCTVPKQSCISKYATSN